MANLMNEHAKTGPVFSSPRALPAGAASASASQSSDVLPGRGPEWLLDRLDQIEFAIAHFGARSQARETGDAARRLDRLERTVERIADLVEERLIDEPDDTVTSVAGIEANLAQLSETLESVEARLANLEARSAHASPALPDEGLAELVQSATETAVKAGVSRFESMAGELVARLDEVSQLAANGSASTALDALGAQIAVLTDRVAPGVEMLVRRPPLTSDTPAQRQAFARLGAAVSTLSKQQGQGIERLVASVASIAHRLESVETQLSEAAARPAGEETLPQGGGAALRSMESLVQRLDSLESRVGPVLETLAAWPDDAMNRVEQRLAELGQAVAGLDGRLGDVAGAQGASPDIVDRLDSLARKMGPALDTLLARPALLTDGAAQRQSFARLGAALSTLSQRQDDAVGRVERRLADLGEAVTGLASRLDEVPGAPSDSHLAERLDALAQKVGPALETLLARPAVQTDGATQRQSFARLGAALSTLSQRQDDATSRFEQRLAALDDAVTGVSTRLDQTPVLALSERLDALIAGLADAGRAPSSAKDLPALSMPKMTLTKMSGQLAAVLVRLNALNRLTEGQAAELRARLGDMAMADDVHAVRNELNGLRQVVTAPATGVAASREGNPDTDEVLRLMRMTMAEILADAQRRAAQGAD